MSSRNLALSVGALVIASACLVTNPVVADAAKQLVTGADIQDGTITSADMKDRYLLAKDFAVGEVPTGTAGPKGTKGDPGGPSSSDAFLMNLPGFDWHLTFGGGGVTEPGSWTLWKLAEDSVYLDDIEGQGVLMSVSGTLDVTEAATVGVGICVVDAYKPGIANKPGTAVYEMGPGRDNTFQVSAWIRSAVPGSDFNVFLCATGLTPTPGGEWLINAALPLGDNSYVSGWADSEQILEERFS